MGFTGSNLAIGLVGAGADVTIVDAMIPGYGGNLYNIAPIESQVTVNFSDIRDANAMNHLVRGHDFVFHLAGQVDHILSLSNPFPDIDMNIKGTTVVMEALRRHNPSAKLIYTGTRGQYGKAVSLPVNEEAATNPKGIYEISNLTAEKIIQVYNDAHCIEAVLLRLTNCYGPRAQMQHPRYGVVNWFVRLAIDDATIKVFGNGKILRDFLFIDDAVEAIMMSAVSPAAVGEVLNVGIDKPTDFIELAETLVAVAGSGRWEFAPFTPEREAQEPGDFYSDISKIRRLVGWTPQTTLRIGLRKTVDFYRAHKPHYWASDD